MLNASVPMDMWDLVLALQAACQYLVEAVQVEEVGTHVIVSTA
jgi:hypothetical protein